MLVDGLIILLNGIPFIYSHNDTLASVVSDSCDLGILFCNSLGSIDHNNDHVCTLYSGYCTDHAVTLDLFFYLTFTAKSCCIDKYIIPVVPCNFCVNGITCGSCDIGYDHSLLTKKFINERRFTYVRFTYDGNLRDIILVFFLTLIRELPDHFIQHISKSLPVSCRNRNWLSDSKIIKFIYIHHIFLMTVYFINYKAYRFSAAAKHICHFCIGVHKPLTHICDKNDHICCINGNLRLFSHSGKNDIAAVRLDTSCIDQGKCSVKPCNICIDPVTCHAWCILYY